MRRAALLAAVFLAGCGGPQDPAPGVAPPPAAAETPDAALRRAMVAEQIEGRGVEDEAVLRAMAAVPRHEFVPGASLRDAYGDHPLPIGHGQTISQPYIVASMTEELGIGPGSKVLEIGTGSGYQAAVLAEITDQVFTVEIVEPLADAAAERLLRLGYSGVRTLKADGWYGWEEHAPYDAIVVTAAPSQIPPKLVEQLAPGGTMVIPVGRAYAVQTLVRVEKDREGKISTRSLYAVRFVPFTGAAGEK